MPEFEWPALPDWFWYPVVFLYGAIVGSFLNVVIYRLPLGKHLSKPASQCPNCHHAITLWENIPIVSFLCLRARCSDCKIPISWRYFCVELVTACIWTLLYHRVADTTSLSWFSFVFQALIAAVLIALVFIDLDHFVAPDELNLLTGALAVGRDLTVLGLAYYGGSFIWDEARLRFLYFGWLPRFAVGAFVYGGVLFLVSLVGFVYYARREGESVGAVTRRFLTFSDDEPESGMAMVGPDAPVEDANESAEEFNSTRLRFSPAFLSILSAAAMIPVVGPIGLLFFIGPLLAFLIIARNPGEAVTDVVRRFFSADDLGLPTLESSEVAQMEAEAEKFAQEAETGQHGAMGLGDVKLALGLGALLGPGMALLSLFVATFIGAITGITLARIHKKGLRYGLPFVPFMAAGALFVMCYGHAMVDWYQAKLHPAKTEPVELPPMSPKARARFFAQQGRR